VEGIKYMPKMFKSCKRRKQLQSLLRNIAKRILEEIVIFLFLATLKVIYWIAYFKYEVLKRDV